MEMQIYIANLGKYNEDELVGAWFTPPIDFEKVKERICLKGEYEEYAIRDYELSFEIGEYTQISEVNHLCEMVMELEDSPIYDVLSEVQGQWFSSLEELLRNKNDIICHSECDPLVLFSYQFRTFFIISHCNSILFSCTLKDLIFLNPCDK